MNRKGTGLPFGGILMFFCPLPEYEMKVAQINRKTECLA
jgi:hypothetical protein